MELALFQKYHIVAERLSKSIMFDSNLSDPLMPGFMVMNFFQSLPIVLEEKKINKVEILTIPLVSKGSAIGKLDTSTKFIKHVKQRVKNDFKDSFDAKVMDTIIESTVGKALAIKRKDESEEIGTMTFMRRAMAFEQSGSDFSKMPVIDEEKERIDALSHAFLLVLVDNILQVHRTMKQLVCYFLFLEICSTDIALFEIKTIVQGNSAFRLPKRKNNGRENPIQYLERKQQEALENKDVLSEYYIKPKPSYQAPKMALDHGNLTLDDIEDKIYSEEVPKKSLLEIRSQEQLDETESILEQLRLEKIKKREEREAKEAIEKSQKLKLERKNKKK